MSEKAVPSKPLDTVPPAAPAGPKTSESSSTFSWMAGGMNSRTSKSESMEQPSSILWPGKPAQKKDEKPAEHASPAAPPKAEPTPPPPAVTEPAPTEPSGAPAPSAPVATPAEGPAETAAPAPASESDLDQRVNRDLEARLDQEVEAELAKVPANRLAEKLREVSGEEMEDRLEVSYILATDPGTTHYGHVQDMHLAAEVRGEEGNTVLIKVAINKNDLREEHIRPGASVTAKVDCGRRSIGYVWFHDLIAFFRKTWFRWF